MRTDWKPNPLKPWLPWIEKRQRRELAHHKERGRRDPFFKEDEMNFEKRLKAQKTIIAIALILMSLVSFNFAVKGTYTIIAFILGFTFLGVAFFVLFGLKKKD